MKKIILLYFQKVEWCKDVRVSESGSLITIPIKTHEIPKLRKIGNYDAYTISSG